MDSLEELQFEVETFAKQRVRKDEKTLWDRLVDSAVGFDASGCDALLLNDVEQYTEKLLSQQSSQSMYDLWQESENGMMSIEQGFDEPCDTEMIHDITIEIIERIVESICREAKYVRRA